jgi:hypothetical protein
VTVAKNEQTEMTSPRLATLALAVVFLFTVVAGGVAMLTSGGDDTVPPSPPTPTTTAPGPVVGDGRFRTPAVDVFGRRVDVPVNVEGEPLLDAALDAQDLGGQTAPPGVVWQRTRYGGLPFTPAHGPATIGPCAAGGFSRTPQGAALAGVHLVSRWAMCGGQELLDFTRRQVVASDADWDFARAWARIKGLNPPHYEVFLRGGYAGDAFRITTYDDEFANIEYAFGHRAPGSWVVVTATVMWQDGQWRLVPDQVRDRPEKTAASIAGWTRW